MIGGIKPMLVFKILLCIAIVLPMLDIYSVGIVFDRYFSLQLYITIVVPLSFIGMNLFDTKPIFSFLYSILFIIYWSVNTDIINTFLINNGNYTNDNESLIIDKGFRDLRKIIFVVAILFVVLIQVLRKINANKRTSSNEDILD